MLSFITSNRTFMTVWFGQVVSNLGSSMTSFGLGVWVYQETGSVTSLAFIVLAARVPALLVSPFAGAIIDRWDRRRAMLLADAGAAIGTLAIMLLLLTGSLELWHLYLALAVSGVFSAFQFPAYGAAVTLMVDKDQYARASGFVQLAGSIGRIAAPAAAAVNTELAVSAVRIRRSAVTPPRLLKSRRGQERVTAMSASSRVGFTTTGCPTASNSGKSSWLSL